MTRQIVDEATGEAPRNPEPTKDPAAAGRPLVRPSEVSELPTLAPPSPVPS